jgi:hypothetical protein
MNVQKLRIRADANGLVPAGRYFEQVARALADAHTETEPGIVRLRTRTRPRNSRP